MVELTQEQAVHDSDSYDLYELYIRKRMRLNSHRYYCTLHLMAAILAWVGGRCALTRNIVGVL